MRFRQLRFYRNMIELASACMHEGYLPGTMLYRTSKDLMMHLPLRQSCSKVKYTGILVSSCWSPAKQTESLLTVTE